MLHVFVRVKPAGKISSCKCSREAREGENHRRGEKKEIDGERERESERGRDREREREGESGGSKENNRTGEEKRPTKLEERRRGQ